MKNTGTNTLVAINQRNQRRRRLTLVQDGSPIFHLRELPRASTEVGVLSQNIPRLMSQAPHLAEQKWTPLPPKNYGTNSRRLNLNLTKGKALAMQRGTQAPACLPRDLLHLPLNPFKNLMTTRLRGRSRSQIRRTEQGQSLEFRLALRHSTLKYPLKEPRLLFGHDY